MAVKGSVWAIAFVVCGLAGCARPLNVDGYFSDRGRDFSDCFRVSVGAGLGIHARARVGIADAGEGFAHCWKVGWDGPAGAEGFVWRKLAATVSLPLLFHYDLDVRGVDAGEPINTFFDVDFGDPELTDLPADVVSEVVDALFHEGTHTRLYRRDIPPGTRDAEHFWLEADVTAGIPSAKLGFNFAEFLDFLFGIGCLDMLGDDVWVKGGPEEEETVSPFLQ